MTTIADIAGWIRDHDRFALMAHIRADGDSLGSCLALRLALERMGKRACVLYPEDIPGMYRFLPGADAICDVDGMPFEPECAIVIDVADEERLGRAAEVFRAVRQRALIDHHEVTKCCVAERNVIRPQAAASGEMIFELIGALGAGMTPDIAACLYTAISTDTGNFNYSNTTPEAMRCSAACIAAGADVSDLTRRLFRLRSPQRVKLLGLALSAVEYRAGGVLALTRVSQRMIDAAGAVHADTDRIVNYLMDTAGVQIAVLAEEVAEGTKFSFRSIGVTDVAALARELGGGGHVHASGATVHSPLDEAVDAMLRVFLPAAEAVRPCR